jgi:protein gp37
MADSTLIEWARHPISGKGATWNPITGCSVVSPGCTNCYAMKLAGTRLKHIPSRVGLTRMGKKGPVWTGEVRFNQDWLDQPLRWRAPRGIFVCAHGDLFAEGVTVDMIDRVFAVMALAPQHLFFVLTKRPKRMQDYIEHLRFRQKPLDDFMSVSDVLQNAAHEAGLLAHAKPLKLARWPLPNVWLGTSVENQEWADARRPPMERLNRRGWTTFVSYEPALGPVDWTGWEFLKWMISGGESGPRPSHPDWHRIARDFCLPHGIAYFFKQWGSWGPDEGPLPDGSDPIMAGDARCARWLYDRWDYGESAFHLPFSDSDELLYHFKNKRQAGRILDGRTHDAFPEVTA